jgi:hypothetical protein
VLLAEFGTGQVFWSLLWLAMFFIWIWLFIVVVGDIFRSHDLGGWGKALWSLFIIFVPYFGVLVYLLFRGPKMHERAALQRVEQDAMMRRYIKDTARDGQSSADEVRRLSDLRAQGVLSDAEFERAKAKALS